MAIVATVADRCLGANVEDASASGAKKPRSRFNAESALGRHCRQIERLLANRG